MNPYRSADDHLSSLMDRMDESEFGGVAGLAQPYPHEPTASETLRALYQSDTTGPIRQPADDRAAVLNAPGVTGTPDRARRRLCGRLNTPSQRLPSTRTGGVGPVNELHVQLHSSTSPLERTSYGTSHSRPGVRR